MQTKNIELHTTRIKTSSIVIQTNYSLHLPYSHRIMHFHIDNSQHNQNTTFCHIHSTYFTMWAIFSSFHTITKTKLHTTIIKTVNNFSNTISSLIFQTFCSLSTPCSHHTTHFRVNNSQCNQNTMFHHILTHPWTLQKTQRWVPKQNNKRKKELGHAS